MTKTHLHINLLPVLERRKADSLAMLLNSDIILPSDPLASDKMGAHKTLACQASRRHQRLLRGGCERHLTRDKSKGLPGAAISNPVLPLGPLCFAEVLSGPGVSLRVSEPVRWQREARCFRTSCLNMNKRGLRENTKEQVRYV